MENEIIQISVIKYRDIEVPIYYNEDEQQYIAWLFNEELKFGLFNSSWKEDLYILIDLKLDTIINFTDYPGARLEWFFNGCNNRDIRLIYRSRVLKIFLVYNEAEINQISVNNMEQECLKILKKICKLMN